MSPKDALSSKCVQTSLLAVLLVLGSGCDRGWLAYRRIEIGDPLGDDHLLARRARKDSADNVKVWGEVAASHLPAIIGWDSVGVLMDDEGAVIAKRYTAIALGHWGLAQTLAARSVMEIEIPPEGFGKPPLVDPDAPDRAATLGEYLTSIEDKLPISIAEDQEELLGGDVFWGPVMLFYLPIHYAFTCTMPCMCGLGDVIDEHPDVMTSGYELRCRDGFGRRFRVRTLGARRIRIESNWFRIVDPLGLLLEMREDPKLRIERAAVR